ncbi:hypothetical protein GOP47_0019239 [Adiantum capillus-veneris]|uniref:Elongation factor P n=1 Tax=Adiantum capillus-veneris TaxID=13818 RepID=A0A9D4UF14_ADICA|nr:hypothetical protein GOP47_0018514 [Adiantum capillus-veneris]KAI5066615.1 hypothetical protein GOP47_0019239 [Adiantum capillus-veneris]
MSRGTRGFLQKARLLCSSNLTLKCARSGLQRACLTQQSRGVKVLGSEIREGNVVERKGRMMEVLKTQHTQQGRGGATIQVELRDVQSGLKSTERFRTSEAIEKVFCEEKTYTFLYIEGDNVFLMEPSTFEQVEVSKSMFGNGAAYLTDGMSVSGQMADGRLLSVAVPQRVTCKVVEAEASYKGQTANPTYKKVVLDNGLQISAPNFIDAEDMIVVDTTDNSYLTRAKA